MTSRKAAIEWFKRTLREGIERDREILEAIGNMTERRKSFKVEQIPGCIEYIRQRLEEEPHISPNTLADEINDRFGLVGNERVSHMAIRRYLDYLEKEDIKRIITGEKSGIDTLLDDFRSRMYKLIAENDAVIEMAKESGNIRTVLAALEQQRRNLVSLIKYGNKITEAVREININYDKVTKVYILNFAKVLCPHCRARVYEVLETELGEEVEKLET